VLRQQLPTPEAHARALIEGVNSVKELAGAVRSAGASDDPSQLLATSSELLQHSRFLRGQSPTTLFRLRLIEIGLPLLLSVVSILLTLRYPLTEQRCYEIKELLKKRREELAATT
jgi:Na+/melibiose symporter-like transporter